jgi:hypothetical protein
VAHPQIAVFARLAKETDQPTRVVAGQATLLARTMHDIRYDAVNDEIVVPNQFGQAILTFRGAADGEEAPIRVINGPSTELQRPDRLDIDTVHDEILVPDIDRILVYPRTGNGDVAPIRVIHGPDTGLTNTSTLAVDPVNNVIAASNRADLLIFNRTDTGNVKPKAVIRGPNTQITRINQIQMYPPKGLIIAAQPGGAGVEPKEPVFIGIWSIHDKGNVAPRWKLGGPKSGLKKPRGVALNPKHKELIVSDMRLNSVLTFYFPEIF